MVLICWGGVSLREVHCQGHGLGAEEDAVALIFWISGKMEAQPSKQGPVACCCLTALGVWLLVLVAV